MGLFGADPEKIQRWQRDGKVAKLRSAVESGGEMGDLARQALDDLVSDPTPFPGATDEVVIEAFRVLMALDQKGAADALVRHANRVNAKSELACQLIDLMGRRGSDAALLALLKLAGSPVGNIGTHAVEAMACMTHPSLGATLQAALLLVGRDALLRLLQVFEKYRLPGVVEALAKRFVQAPPDLKKPIAKALHRQGVSSVRVTDPELKAYLLVEESRFREAAALGAPAWYPLAEALGANPTADERTQEVLAALGMVDPARLRAALRLKVLKVVQEALDRPSNSTYAAAHRVADWAMPAWGRLVKQDEKGRELSQLIRKDSFLAARGILESE